MGERSNATREPRATGSPALVELGKLLDLWVSGRVARGEIVRTTGANDRWVLLGFAESVRGRSIGEVTREDVQRWIDGKAALKRTTRREHLRVLRAFFDWQVAAGVIARNPTSGVSVPMPPEVLAKPRRYGPLPRAVDDIAIEYLCHLERRGLRLTSIARRRHQLNRLDTGLGPDTRLVHATPNDLVAYMDSLRGHSPEYRHGEIVAIRGFYRWAVIEDYIGRDPSARLTLPRRRQGLPRPMPDADVALALEAADASPLRQWIHLAAFVGLRASEISAVRREELIESTGGATLVVAEGKGGKSRAVPIADELATLLGDADLPRVGFLFTHGTVTGRPVTGPQVSKRTNRWLHNLGIAHPLHSLRHFYATKLYDRTKNLRLVQERMGHASPVVTSQYTRILADECADEIRDLPRWWREQCTTADSGCAR